MISCLVACGGNAGLIMSRNCAKGMVVCPGLTSASASSLTLLSLGMGVFPDERRQWLERIPFVYLLYVLVLCSFLTFGFKLKLV